MHCDNFNKLLSFSAAKLKKAMTKNDDAIAEVSKALAPARFDFLQSVVDGIHKSKLKINTINENTGAAEEVHFKNHVNILLDWVKTMKH